MRSPPPLLPLLASLAVALAAPPAAVRPARAQVPPAAAPTDGATLFRRQCAVCHTVKPGEPNRQGPNLNGVFGRPAGKLEGFRYSAALAGASLVWDEQTLDRWLADSAGLVPGSVMPYRQPSAAMRGAIIQWLKDGAN
ncbi:c-type cytochrome [Roseomonas sp. OT10]|uniref:c-type cytochrome n=1 Tax=Roseomonas cutis TaxID=2897332 RepID=UPI001E3604FB|nr:c-type cytochrome [Roseomonas sp. OT10]UFN49554.1 c-type cytochrome [Roseomonas sp. OT10]